MITSHQKGKIMVMEDAKATKAMATLDAVGALDSHTLHHTWGSIRMKQVRVCL
jgi:UDP-N-acetylmuramoylalanine-D-glutamate ligase